MTLQKNTPYTGTIEKTVFGGKGMLKKDDFVVFVKNGIEGQMVEYEIVKKKKNFAEATIINVITPSPLEIPKEDQRNILPGCAYQNIEYLAQLGIKHAQLKEIFRMFPKVELPEVLPSPKTDGYRNKMEFSIGYESMTSEIINERKVWTDEGVAVGFHPPKNWARVISIDDVFLASESVNILRRTFENFLKQFLGTDTKTTPWNALIGKGFWRSIIFRQSESSGDILVNIVVSKEENADFWKPWIDLFLETTLPEKTQISGILQTVHTGKNDAIVDPHVSVLWGTDVLEEQLREKTFEISPFSFFQTNTKGAEVLYSTIKKYIGDTQNKTVLDLFCGTGSIGIFCADDAKKVVGVELVEEAVEMANKNAEKNSLKNTVFLAGKAEKLLPEVLDAHTFDTVIIDPPRSGMHPKALQMIANIPIQKLVYVSCNPTTLARDSKELEQVGWKLVCVQGVDMFPHTPHVECVSVLEKV